MNDPHAFKNIVGLVRRGKTLNHFRRKSKISIGHALYQAQLGGKSRWAKPLAGFGGASVMEIVDDQEGDTYRAVYTLRFSEVIYVLHAFQKKSKKGISTPKTDLNLIKKRLKLAEEDYQKRQRGSG